MRILMLGFDHTMIGGKDGTPGDTQERHLKYAAALRQAYPDGKLTVLVKTPENSSSQAAVLSEGLTIYPVPCSRWKYVWDAGKAFHARLKHEKFDLITTQTPFDDGWLGIRLKQRFGIPVNAQMRASFLNMTPWIQERPLIYRIFNQLGKWVVYKADTVRVVSEGEKARLERLFPKLRGKIFALHPLVNIQMFSESPKTEDIERVEQVLRHHNMGEKPFLLFVGRFAHQKNLPTLLRAYAEVQQTHPQSRLVLAGDGPLRGELEQLARQLAVDRSILWLGTLPLPQLRAWYTCARATVLPSFYEGVAKVLLESYLCGAPAIVTPFVCTQELLRHGETGLITQSFTDAGELAHNMRILFDSPELAQNMAEQGKAYLLAHYVLPEDVYMQRLLEIWKYTAHQ